MGGISYVIHILRSLTKSDFFREIDEVREQGRKSQDWEFQCIEKKMGKVKSEADFFVELIRSKSYDVNKKYTGYAIINPLNSLRSNIPKLDFGHLTYFYLKRKKTSKRKLSYHPKALGHLV